MNKGEVYQVAFLRKCRCPQRPPEVGASAVAFPARRNGSRSLRVEAEDMKGLCRGLSQSTSASKPLKLLSEKAEEAAPEESSVCEPRGWGHLCLESTSKVFGAAPGCGFHNWGCFGPRGP